MTPLTLKEHCQGGELGLSLCFLLHHYITSVMDGRYRLVHAVFWLIYQTDKKQDRHWTVETPGWAVYLSHCFKPLWSQESLDHLGQVFYIFAAFMT